MRFLIGVISALVSKSYRNRCSNDFVGKCANAEIENEKIYSGSGR